MFRRFPNKEQNRIYRRCRELAGKFPKLGKGLVSEGPIITAFLIGRRSMPGVLCPYKPGTLTKAAWCAGVDTRTPKEIY